MNETSRSELTQLTALRNEVAHHSGLYRLVIDAGAGQIVAEEKPLPHVSHEDVTKAVMVVTETCDAIFVAMSTVLFGAEPQVRPLTPQLAEVFTRQRQGWEGRQPEPIPEYLEPNWSVKTASDPHQPWVGDEDDAFLIMPTGLDRLPVLISFLWNKRHGMMARAGVDDGPLEDLTNGRALLEQMLVGRSILVEFYDDWHDGPQYARFGLSGFASAWKAAWEKKAATEIL
jgi:hypothetical protein